MFDKNTMSFCYLRSLWKSISKNLPSIILLLGGLQFCSANLESENQMLYIENRQLREELKRLQEQQAVQSECIEESSEKNNRSRIQKETAPLIQKKSTPNKLPYNFKF